MKYTSFSQTRKQRTIYDGTFILSVEVMTRTRGEDPSKIRPSHVDRKGHAMI